MKTILVTGACGDIGRAVVEQLSRDGYLVWAIGRSEEKLINLFGANSNVRTYVSDLASEEVIRDMVRHVVKETGPLSGVLHCAGFDKLCPLSLIKRKDTLELFNIHVLPAMDLCKWISKEENATKGCSVVLISSMAAHEGAKCHSSYATVKGALEGFLAPAAAELSQKGIRLNVVVLGAVDTKMTRGYLDKMNEEQQKDFMRDYPLGLGSSKDITGIFSFLLGENSSWITGRKFYVDGGYCVR